MFQAMHQHEHDHRHPQLDLGYSDNGAGTITYTLPGDATLDGTVDSSDELALAQNYGHTDTDWQEGDFNYDGVTNSEDLLILAQNYGHSIGAQPDTEIGGETFDEEYAPLLQFAAKVGALPEVEAIRDERNGIAPTAVPEPPSLRLVAVAAAGLPGRKRAARFAILRPYCKPLGVATGDPRV